MNRFVTFIGEVDHAFIFLDGCCALYKYSEEVISYWLSKAYDDSGDDRKSHCKRDSAHYFILRMVTFC